MSSYLINKPVPFVETFKEALHQHQIIQTIIGKL